MYCRIDWGIKGLTVQVESEEEACTNFSREFDAGISTGAVATAAAVVGAAPAAAGATIGLWGPLLPTAAAGAGAPAAVTLAGMVATGPPAAGVAITAGLCAYAAIWPVAAVTSGVVVNRLVNFKEVNNRKVALQHLQEHLQEMADTPRVYDMEYYNCNMVRDELFYAIMAEHVEYEVTGEHQTELS